MVGIREPAVVAPVEVESVQKVTKGPVPRVKRLEKPNKVELEEQIKQKHEEVDALQKRIKEIKDTLDVKQQSRQLISQELADARTRLNELNASYRGLVEEKKAVREELELSDKSREQMRANARALKDKLPFVKAEQIDEEVKRLEYKMHHTSLSLQEEKKLMQQIKELVKSREGVKDYNERLSQITEDEGSRGVHLEKIKALVLLLTKLKAQQEDQRKVIADIKDRETSEGVDIPALYEERNAAINKTRALRDEVKELRVQFRVKEEEYYDREREFRQQQNAERKRAFEMREAERKKREAERKQKELENFVEPFTDEIILCDQLLSFLQKYVTPSGDETPVAPVQKLEITAPKGVGELLVPKKSRNDEALDGWFGGFGGKAKNKKGKTPAPHKNKEKATITLSVDIVDSFAKVKLSPPSTVGDVPKSLEEVKLAKQNFVKLQEEAKEAREKKLEDGAVRERTATPGNEAVVDSLQHFREGKDEGENNGELHMHIEVSAEQELGIFEVPDEGVASTSVTEQDLLIVKTAEQTGAIEAGAQDYEDDLVSADAPEQEAILVEVTEQDLGIIAGQQSGTGEVGEVIVVDDAAESEVGPAELAADKPEKANEDIMERELPLAVDSAPSAVDPDSA